MEMSNLSPPNEATEVNFLDEGGPALASEQAEEKFQKEQQQSKRPTGWRRIVLHFPPS